jgi:hypothetical protein
VTNEDTKRLDALEKRIERIEWIFNLASEQEKEEIRSQFLKRRHERREMWRKGESA